MKAEIIAVGSELLLGQILNTNAQFLSKELAELGIDVYIQTVVGDNEERLADNLTRAINSSDLVILTGGLGPTKDDLTKETVAKVCGKSLEFNQEALTYITDYFERRKRHMTENNKKQAVVIEGSHVLANHFGMAPGMVVTVNDGLVALVPGPPKEMEPMFKNELKPFLLSKLQINTSITSRVLRFFNIGESQLETEIEDLIEQQSNPTIAPLAGDGEVTLRLTVKSPDSEEAKRKLDETEALITARVGQYLYGYNDTSLVEQLFLYLKKTNSTISVAESLTGGMFAMELTSLSGASEVFQGGTVAYATEVKENVLGVSKNVIEQYGVISKECAIEMAKGAKHLFKSDIAIGLTGVAGPGLQEEKEPGTVYIGIVGPEHQEQVFELSLGGGRHAVRERTIKYSCFYLLNEMKRWNLSE
ncbi:competence/damage-inducible protein A [Halalkalibacter urbisdiaboli]|uniref:competence/damage-inducible protein A n=1 Tax=Halalkalibacter urbisdiaboli TaxID=1960589 RepID=UPI000B448082|nr:competence/damage-inducible protein A [Halalkalibacter urbisdiaboli]